MTNMLTATAASTEVSKMRCLRYAAPKPFRTAGMVRARIFRSSHSDHLSMYCISISIHCSNGIALRP